MKTENHLQELNALILVEDGEKNTGSVQVGK